jgi:hypothetical protein
MKSERLLRLCERVFGSLDRAVVEGYENVLVNSAEETAAEIGEYDSKLGDVPTDVLRPIVAAWLAAQDSENAPKQLGTPSSAQPEFTSATTGRPVTTLEEAVHDMLDTILCGEPLSTSTPEDVALQLSRRGPLSFFGCRERTYQELIPHVQSWFEEHSPLGLCV